MDLVTQTSLDALLMKATNSNNLNFDTAALEAFCSLINKEKDGAHMGVKVIAARLPTGSEKEVLQTLNILDTCMNKCGVPFQNEVGKFRFLNEMIKLVSPKYLGSHTPLNVKQKILQLLYVWTLDYPKETKIKEAFDMLRKQGVIKEIPNPNVPSYETSGVIKRKQSSVFQDEEKSKILQKLLQSKDPEDIQAANWLIKSMVREDDKRTELKSKSLTEIESIQNNVRLLNEMLDSYKPGVSSSDELELINELYQNCQGLKTPATDKLVLESIDYESSEISEGMLIPDGGDVLQPVTVLKYDKVTDTEKDKNKFKALEDLDVLGELLMKENLQKSKQTNFSRLNQDKIPMNLLVKSENKQQSTTLTGADSLDLDLSCLLKPQSRLLPADPKPIQDSTDDFLVDISDEKLLEADKTTEILKADSSQNGEKSNQNSVQDRALQFDFKLSDIFIKLENIKPSNIPPMIILDNKNCITVTLHLGKDKPKEGVNVYVLTTINKNSLPLSDYLFQAVVPKGCKLKLQPPSSTDLPAHNPFLPPSAITQILLIANPINVQINLKFIMSYTMDDESITEMGEVDSLPSI